MFFPDILGNITVPKAIQLGKQRVIYPTLFVFYLLYFCHVFFRGQPWWIQALSFMASFAAIVLYWSVAASRWRVWAFSLVKDIRTLHDRALAERIIPDYKDWVYKIEWKTAAQKTFWSGIARALEQDQTAHALEEDFEVPDETVVYYSRIGWVSWGILTFVLSICIYFTFKTIGKETTVRKDWLIPVCFAVCLLIFGKEYFKLTKRLFSKKLALITMNRKGLFLKEETPVKWKDIESASVQTYGSGDNQTDVLVLQAKTDEVRYYRTYTKMAQDEDEAYEDIEYEPVSKTVYDGIPEDDHKYAETIFRNITVELTNYGIEAAELEHRLNVYRHRFGR